MKKTYVEKITSWVASNKSKRSKSLASFLAQKSDINDALDEGFSTYVIWTHQASEGNISMSYRQFCRYVDKHIGKTEKIIKARKNKKDEKPKTTFTFNPVPNEEDLY